MIIWGNRSETAVFMGVGSVPDLDGNLSVKLSFVRPEAPKVLHLYSYGLDGIGPLVGVFSIVSTLNLQSAAVFKKVKIRRIQP